MRKIIPLLKKYRILIFPLLIICAAVVARYFHYNQTPIGTFEVNEVFEVDSYKSSDYSYLDKTLPLEKRVDDLVGRMTTQEKIGQLALVEKNSIPDPLVVVRYGLGAVMSGLGAKPETNTPHGWLEMVNSYISIGRRSRLGIPVLYGVDTNHGHSNVPGATIFPHFIGLGATHDADLVYRVGKASSAEMKATNIFWSFSPDLDVVMDTRWGRTYETFGSDPTNVSKLGKAYIEGLQSKSNAEIGAMATAKHYVGTGDMEWGRSNNKDFFIDQGISNISETTLRDVHLPPFKVAVDSGVMSVMAGLNTWQGKKLAANKYLLSSVLKNELNFQGLVVSDWYGVYEISPNKYYSLVTAINAGVDMVMLPFEYKSFMVYMEKAIKNGDISTKRLDDAVRRILTAKFKLGLFDTDIPVNPNLSVIGSQANRDVAREAVRKSIVALKNENSALPLSKRLGTVAVSGQSANNLGRQMGGWTVEWQGIDGNWIPGTTLLDGIKSAVSAQTKVEFNETGDFPSGTKADVGIAIVGEKPYAEGWGDLDNPILSEEDLTTIQKTKSSSNKLVVVIVSGRPLDIKKYQKEWDAVVAAWLPGSEGAGLADVLFGDYPFKGTLPVNWELE